MGVISKYVTVYSPSRMKADDETAVLAKHFVLSQMLNVLSKNYNKK